MTFDLANVEIWECDPLVIADSNDAVLFAGRAQVEFTPSKIDPILGLMEIPEALLGHRLKITIEGKKATLPSAGPGWQFAFREGRTLWGRDDAEAAYTLYIGTDAEQFLRERRGS